MVTLYVMSTGDGWEDVLFAGMDSVAPGVAPQRSDFNAYAIYFLAWIFVGNFIALNLFIGAIVDNFIRIKAETLALAPILTLTLTPTLTLTYYLGGDGRQRHHDRRPAAVGQHDEEHGQG